MKTKISVCMIIIILFGVLGFIVIKYKPDSIDTFKNKYGIELSDPYTPAEKSENDKDFSQLTSPESQEKAYEYKSFFIPSADGENQPYVGDPMPYYENGVYYIYYLKDGGDSYNHSVYLTTTSDFVTYTEYDTPILEADRSGGQDTWIGTGSVVKVKDLYYFFYTGHNDAEEMEYKEKIMVAVGSSLTEFKKLDNWEIAPPDELGQKRDFRDPQVYYDSETDTLSMTITACKDGVARVLKYTLSADLKNVQYDGIIFTDSTGKFWNLECTDTFCIGDTWYLTYSAQDDTLWYATSEQRFGPYSEPERLDGKLFYAAKHIESGENCYMVGWVRRSKTPSFTDEITAWAGNIVVQKVIQKADKSLVLSPVDTVVNSFSNRRSLTTAESYVYLPSALCNKHQDIFTSYERFMLTGKFTFSRKGAFGLSFDCNNKDSQRKSISICPKDDKIKLTFNDGENFITETDAQLFAGKTYSFTYVQEGSVGVFYLDGETSLTVRLYGVSGKTVSLFAENNEVLFNSLCLYTEP